MIESMAIGLPCVVTDCPCGGAKMMIEDKVNGILVEVGNVKSLYTGIKSIIEDDEMANRISINAEKIKIKLNQEDICKIWKSLI